MDKFIDVIVDGILSNFDFGFMFIVNVLTYIIIKVIDYFNGDNKVPTWQKKKMCISYKYYCYDWYLYYSWL